MDSKKYRICKRCELPKIEKSRHPKAEYCNICLKVVRSDNLRGGRVVQRDLRKVRKERDRKFDPKYQSFIMLKAPDGSTIKLRDEDERSFYEARRNSYVVDFEWSASADNSLLTRLLFMELECKRQETLISETPSNDKTEQLVRLTRMLRELQHSLGIDRQKRMSESEKATAKSVIIDMLKKFKEYREKNKDRYCHKCQKCGYLNYTYRKNNATAPD